MGKIPRKDLSQNSELGSQMKVESK